MVKIKRALVSVSDKTNLDILAKFLIDHSIETVSTGGTFKRLKELDVPVIKVSDQTDFPEIMDGRVKTLHPKIHMGLLARADHSSDAQILKEYRVEPFDLLVVNLYPFSQKKNEIEDDLALAEFIDVGGPSMTRAGAKNFERILTVTDPSDYNRIGLENSYEFRKKMAAKAFDHLSCYDREIASWLDGSERSLRYGENPHQTAKWYPEEVEGVHNANILQGKALSFNNLVDLTAAVESLAWFSETPAVVSVKHNNPCGIGRGESLLEATRLSLGADPQSVFGGIIALNRSVDEDVALELSNMFLECVIAPSYSDKAKQIFEKKKNLRLMEWSILEKGYFPKNDFKRVSGGKLVQSSDSISMDWDEWSFVTKLKPDANLRDHFQFAWRSVARLKSNAIAITAQMQTLGLGMGQVNRVDAVNIAIERWKRFHSKTSGPFVLASDAFFPFPDSIELASKAGIGWIIQPGGSIKDEEVIAKANELGVGMVFTGKRHFLH